MPLLRLLYVGLDVELLYAAMSLATIGVELYLAFALVHGGARFHFVAVALGIALHVLFELSGFIIGQFSWMMVGTFVALLRDRHSVRLLARWRAAVRACDERVASLFGALSRKLSKSPSPSSSNSGTNNASSSAYVLVGAALFLVLNDLLLMQMVRTVFKMRVDCVKRCASCRARRSCCRCARRSCCVRSAARCSL